MARNDRAVAEIYRANELDPLYLMASAEIGWVAYFGGRLDQAVAGCRRTLEMDPNYLFAMSCLQMALALKKDPETIPVGKKLVELTAGDPYFLGQLGWTYGVLGHREEAQRILKQLLDMPSTQPAPPPAVYYVYLGLGDREKTMDWLEKAYAGRWSDVAWINSGPEYDWLRDDPRFQALIRKLKFDT
jgi:tetratricopeptide (TPR) repeat protein